MTRGLPKKFLEAMRAIPIFSGCTLKELRIIAGLGTQVEVEVGAELTKEGSYGAELIIVLAGEATCMVGTEEVARFAPGDFFGEMSLLDNGLRSATVVALTPMEVMVLDGREFKRLIDSSPGIAWKMLVALARRIRRADEALTN